MSLTHCPLCMLLAVVSAARGLSYGLLVWQLLAGRSRPSLAAA